ncbi:hypothetical protein Glove_132g152 [Diversispora epigaea]|uniref:Chitin-binding type-2 domain-containing protein n=1 Tax=Diversispora epigaea TaxID=1348612 RepID=A0A397J1J8_9GLOM|nr:hypothetical protein Glove_132g152 [Diversispora epigaea]
MNEQRTESKTHKDLTPEYLKWQAKITIMPDLNYRSVVEINELREENAKPKHDKEVLPKISNCIGTGVKMMLKIRGQKMTYTTARAMLTECSVYIYKIRNYQRSSTCCSQVLKKMGEKDYKKPPFFIYKHSIDLKKLQKIFIRPLIITFFNMNKRSITLLSITKYLYLLCIIGFVTSQKLYCPEDNSEVIYYPNPDNCSEFYQCDHGTPVLQKCPIGYHFDPVILVCDYAQSAGCEDLP